MLTQKTKRWFLKTHIWHYEAEWSCWTTTKNSASTTAGDVVSRRVIEAAGFGTAPPAVVDGESPSTFRPSGYFYFFYFYVMLLINDVCSLQIITMCKILYRRVGTVEVPEDASRWRQDNRSLCACEEKAAKKKRRRRMRQHGGWHEITDGPENSGFGSSLRAERPGRPGWCDHVRHRVHEVRWCGELCSSSWGPVTGSRRHCERWKDVLGVSLCCIVSQDDWRVKFKIHFSVVFKRVQSSFVFCGSVHTDGRCECTLELVVICYEFICEHFDQ